MQQKSKHTFVKSKMNKDLDARLLEAGEYRDGVNVSVSRSESDDVGALENILGNEILSNLTYNIFENQNPLEIIGWHIQQNTDNIYLFLTNNQDNSSDQISNKAGINTIHRILQFNIKTNVTSVLVEGYFLNFSMNSPILHTNLIENLLFWTDNRNQPRKINVDTALADPNYYTNEDSISVAKYYPWNTIKVIKEFKASGAIIDKDSTNDAVVWPNGYNAWRNYMVLNDNTPQETLDFLAGSVGTKGYIIDDNGDRWEFTVAWFQYDSVGAAPGGILPSLGPSYADKPPVVFIERNMQAPNFILSTGPGDLNEYEFNFYGGTAKDVSSQWLEESKSKLEITGFGDVVGGGFPTNSIIYNPVGINYCAPLYKYGTRSTQLGLSVPEYGNNTIATVCPSFDYSTTPFGGTDFRKYGIIKHNKLPQGVFYYIFDVVDNPANPTTANHYFNIVDQDGNPINASTIGLDIGDIVTVYWPNPNWNPNFAGDEAFLEDKFVRFAYRFLYDDGEYSVISPFTQPVFIPKQKGYFEKRIGSVKTTPQNPNYFLNQEDEAGRTTIVDFFLNEVSEVNLQIPTEVPVNELGLMFKVKEIDILYKESTSLALKVVKTIPINDPNIISNATNNISYIYQSEKPIKVLKSSEIGRVFDNVPIRAAAQESTGNRIIYGNFYDRHTSPLTLDYLVNASPKFTLHNSQTSNSNISYPNHTLKQNRTYQAGIVLSDRYGRQSDVILSSFVGDAVDILPSPNVPTLRFGSSTLYHPYKSTVISPLTSSLTFNTTTHVDAGILTWPGDSLKLLFSNTIPNTINTADGYPGLYYNNVTSIQNTATLPVVVGSNVQITVNLTYGQPLTIRPGMELEWTDTDGIVYSSVINGAFEFAGDLVISIEDNNPIWIAGPGAGSIYNILDNITLGWYSYKVVVKQQEQDYYNVYLASLLNGNPVVKPFNLTMATSPLGSTLLTVDATMFEPRTFLLLEGMNFKVPGFPNTEYTITNILNNDQFQITPPLANALPALTIVEFTTKSTKDSINVTTLLTDNANKVPPGLIETTPIQQQYSTSKTRLIPRVAVMPDYVGLNASSPNVNGPVFPGKESAKVTALGNFAGLFVDGKYDGLWQADTDPPAMIVQNKFQLGVFAQDAKPDSSASAVDQLQFSCYETTPDVSEIEIFYETSTSGLVQDLNTLIIEGTAIPTKIIPYFPVPTYEELGTVEWNEERGTVGFAGVIQKIQFVDQLNNILLPSASGGVINSITYISENYVNGQNSQMSYSQAGVDYIANTYSIELAYDPGEAALGVYYLDLTGVAYTSPDVTPWGLIDSAGQYFREDVSFNNIDVSLSINVEVFGPGTGYFVDYPFTLSTALTNAPPLDKTSLSWVEYPVRDMIGLDTYGVSYNVNNNSGSTETGQDPTSTDPSFPTVYGTQTKTYNGANNTRLNRSVNEPGAVDLAGSLELLYELWVEVDGSNVPTSGTGVYANIDELYLLEGISLEASLFGFEDGAESYIVNLGNVLYDGSNLTSPISLAIKASDCNGSTQGSSTTVSRFELDIQY